MVPLQIRSAGFVHRRLLVIASGAFRGAQGLNPTATATWASTPPTVATHHAQHQSVMPCVRPDAGPQPSSGPASPTVTTFSTEIERAIAAMRRIPAPCHLAYARLDQAHHLLITGDHVAAESAVGEAAEIAERLRAAPLRERAHAAHVELAAATVEVSGG